MRVIAQGSPDADMNDGAVQIETEAQHQEAVIKQELAEGGDVHVAAGTPGAHARRISSCAVQPTRCQITIELWSEG